MLAQRSIDLTEKFEGENEKENFFFLFLYKIENWVKMNFFLIDKNVHVRAHRLPQVAFIYLFILSTLGSNVTFFFFLFYKFSKPRHALFFLSWLTLPLFQIFFLKLVMNFFLIDKNTHVLVHMGCLYFYFLLPWRWLVALFIYLFIFLIF